MHPGNGVQQRRIALNKPLSFQPTHTLKARRWGKSTRLKRKLDVRNTPILLQLIKNVTIDTVEIFARRFLLSTIIIVSLYSFPTPV